MMLTILLLISIISFSMIAYVIHKLLGLEKELEEFENINMKALKNMINYSNESDAVTQQVTIRKM